MADVFVSSDPTPQSYQTESASGPARMIWEQQIASASWAINHNLGCYPSVIVVDSSGTIQEGSLIYSDTNNVTVSFAQPFAGMASLL